MVASVNSRPLAPTSPLSSLAAKLHPSRFPNMSGKMVAILSYLLDQEWTSPKITSMSITSDHMVLSMEDGDIGFNTIIGSESDLTRNFTTLLEYPGVNLTPQEKSLALSLLQSRITRW